LPEWLEESFFFLTSPVRKVLGSPGRVWRIQNLRCCTDARPWHVVGSKKGEERVKGAMGVPWVLGREWYSQD
jgi:hypothetical protein